MKTLKINSQFDFFLKSLKGNNLITQNDPSIEKKENKYSQFDFKVKYFLTFDRNGLLLINKPISEFSSLSIKFIDKLKMIAMKLGYLNKKYFEVFYRHLKIFFYNDNFIYVCIISSKSNSCLIRLYLYFLNIIYLNLIGDNVKNTNCLINISKIFEVYFVPTLTMKFCKVMEYILSNKEKNSSDYSYKFKSLLIFHSYKNINIFNYRKIVYRKESKNKYNILKNRKIFNTIYNLVNQPLYKNNFISPKEIYSHKLELLSTFPRWMIFGKYFKIYNGLYVIEIFSSRKLSKSTVNYKEFDIKNQADVKEYDLTSSRHSYKFIKLIELFAFNYLETISNIVSKFYNPKNELLYFDLDLLIVINDVISLKLDEDELINLIYKRLQLYLINKIKLGDNINSILLEEKNENSNSYSNSNISGNNDKNNKNKSNDNENEEEENESMTTISKSFLQIDGSDLFEEIYQKRRSLQLSSFESNDQVFNTSEISEPFQNISYIRNYNNNNDEYSISSFRQNEPKKKTSAFELFSMIDKQGGIGADESVSLSKKITEKSINIFKHRNTGPTYNIIVNNNRNNGLGQSKKKVSLQSLKLHRNNYLLNRKKNSINSNIKNIKSDIEKRSNSFTESGLFLKQFYSLMNNTKFIKNKHQILKEIQNKISKQNYSLKRNNSLKDLQIEFKLKNESPFIQHNFQNGKKSEEESASKISASKISVSKISANNIYVIKNYSLKNDDEDEKFNKDNGGEIMQEYYCDKSSINFIKTDDSVLNKLNKDY